MPASDHAMPEVGFVKPPDLTNPVDLVRMCEEAAHGISQHGSASATGSLVGGHPNPQFLFNQAKAVLLAAAQMIRANVPVTQPGRWGKDGRWETPTPSPVPAGAGEGEKKDDSKKK